jgi:hypothetical protein
VAACPQGRRKPRRLARVPASRPGDGRPGITICGWPLQTEIDEIEAANAIVADHDPDA